MVVGCRKCVPTRARGEREGGAVSSGCWLKCALGNGRLAYQALGWAGLHSTRLGVAQLAFGCFRPTAVASLTRSWLLKD